MSFARFTTAAAACSLASAALAGTLHDLDVILEQGAEGIVTTRVVSGDATEPERVYDADMISFFGNIATEDPGFNAALGEFPAFALMSLDIADELTVWNGAGFDPVDPAFYLEIEFNNQVAQSPTTPGALVPGPIFNTTEFGDIHNHPDHFLVVNDVPGIYLGAFRMSSDTLGDSEIFYFVYRWEPTSGDIQAAEAEQQAAIQWVRDNLLVTGCAADLSGDGVVGASDLAALIAAWGTDAGDLDGDANTAASDLAALIAAWGTCD